MVKNQVQWRMGKVNWWRKREELTSVLYSQRGWKEALQFLDGGPSASFSLQCRRSRWSYLLLVKQCWIWGQKHRYHGLLCTAQAWWIQYDSRIAQQCPCWKHGREEQVRVGKIIGQENYFFEVPSIPSSNLLEGTGDDKIGMVHGNKISCKLAWEVVLVL